MNQIDMIKNDITYFERVIKDISNIKNIAAREDNTYDDACNDIYISLKGIFINLMTTASDNQQVQKIIEKIANESLVGVMKIKEKEKIRVAQSEFKMEILDSIINEMSNSHTALISRLHRGKELASNIDEHDEKKRRKIGDRPEKISTVRLAREIKDKESK